MDADNADFNDSKKKKSALICANLFPIWFLLLSALACRPVIAIGWPEFLILVIVIVFLFWPLIARIYRIVDKVNKASKDEEEKK